MGSGIQKRIKKAMEAKDSMDSQLKNIDENLKQLFANDNKMAAWVDEKYSKHEEILSALIEIIGTQKVFEEIKKARIEKAEANSASQKEALDKGLAEGTVKAVDEVTDTSIIVGSEVDKDGNVIPPARSQILFASLPPELADLLRAKKVGDVVETMVNSKFTIKEIYEMVLPSPAPVDPTKEAVQVSDGSVN